MEIFASVLAVVVAFIALWVASDSLGRGEKQYRALLDSHIKGLRTDIEALSATTQTAAADILRLEQQLAELRADLARSDETVASLTEEVAEARKALLASPASTLEHRRRA